MKRRLMALFLLLTPAPAALARLETAAGAAPQGATYDRATSAPDNATQSDDLARLLAYDAQIPLDLKGLCLKRVACPKTA